MYSQADLHHQLTSQAAKFHCELVNEWAIIIDVVVGVKIIWGYTRLGLSLGDVECISNSPSQPCKAVY